MERFMPLAHFSVRSFSLFISISAVRGVSSLVFQTIPGLPWLASFERFSPLYSIRLAIFITQRIKRVWLEGEIKGPIDFHSPLLRGASYEKASARAISSFLVRDFLRVKVFPLLARFAERRSSLDHGVLMIVELNCFQVPSSLFLLRQFIVLKVQKQFITKKATVY